MKPKQPKCFFCSNPIHQPTDLYYLFVYICQETTGDFEKETKYLHVCDRCFHSHADQMLKDGIAKSQEKDWKICPYCNDKCAYTKRRMQISEILGSEMNSILIHIKCYTNNIGISYDQYS